MDCSRMVISHQVPAAASDDPYFNNKPCSSLIRSPFSELNHDWESVLLDFGDVSDPISLDEILCQNGSSQANPASWVDTPTVTSGLSTQSGAAQLDFKPHVYGRSPSLKGVYVPPPCGQVVELRSEPPDQLQFVDDITMVPICASDIAVRSLSSNIPACGKRPPASNFNPGSYQFSAEYHHLYSESKPSQASSPFGFHHVGAEYADKLSCHDAVPDEAKLTNPPYIPPQNTLQSSIGKAWHTPMRNISASAMANAVYSGVKSSVVPPIHMPTNIISPKSEDLEILEMSSVSAPAALPPSDSLPDQTFTLTESGSLTMPSSPTPSVNKGGGSRRRRLCSRIAHKIDIEVQTTLLNLNDGFAWKKYGEKIIKGKKFTRSYFKCDELARFGCTTVKRVQKCDDGQHILFTYIGRHNHPN